ncbi:MAG: GAF domain-containing protein [Pyrinomonadaceae bacterium]|jgi:L-methionine (R)-S-oxide reductase
MAENISFTRDASRATIYSEIAPQISAIIDGEPDLIANLANTAAILKQALNFYWVGFYLARDGELVLGPFQGPLACTRIAFDRGVCGHCYTGKKTVIVPDVNEFPGHIACSTEAKSEIVVPLFDPDGRIVGVLDVDSDRLDDFNETDKTGLEEIARRLAVAFLPERVEIAGRAG